MTWHIQHNQRVDSGPVKFGGDWTGYFLRGDEALWWAKVMTAAAEAIKSPLSVELRRFASELEKTRET